MTSAAGYHTFDDDQVAAAVVVPPAPPGESSSPVEMKSDDFAALQQLPGNDRCVDCGTKSPDWGSPALGILFCLKCSGVHRGLGTHISFVRSVRMDAWTPQQVQLMKQGGNQRCTNFLQAHGITASTMPTDGDLREGIRQKYDSPAAKLYKEVLKAEVEGRPVPTELPPEDTKLLPTTPQSTSAPRPRRMEGFGSSPLPEPEPRISGKRILYVGIPVVAAAVIWLLVPH